MLSAKVVPPAARIPSTPTLRAAYDALPAETKARIDGLRVHHSIAHSRQTLGFEFSQEEEERSRARSTPSCGRCRAPSGKSLYVASHASRIIDWPVPEGRLLLRDLIEHATQREFVYRHRWRVGDLVIWDNRATMHRATPFDDTKYRRELRRVTTLDIPSPPWSPVRPGAGLNSTPRPLTRGRASPPINTRLAGKPLARRTCCPRHSRLPARRSQREPARSPQRREHRARAARAVSSSSYPLPRSWSSHRARRGGAPCERSTRFSASAVC